MALSMFVKKILFDPLPIHWQFVFPGRSPGTNPPRSLTGGTELDRAGQSQRRSSDSLVGGWESQDLSRGKRTPELSEKNSGHSFFSLAVFLSIGQFLKCLT
jgi:hypothetical protein